MSYTQVPSIGCPAPDFECMALVGPNQFKTLKLSDYKEKWVVLFFYPLDFTFVCPTEIIDFSDANKRFADIGAALIGASVDSHFTHQAWTQQDRGEGGLGAINIPLLADLDKKVSNAYGAMLGNCGHTLRATYIIDNKGILRHLSFNDAPVGRNIEEVFRLVQAFQFTDKNGEVCPSNWNPGSDTIIPNPQDKLKYFSSKK